MVVVVLSKVAEGISRKVLGSTLAGDDLLVRIRSISIGLLGLVAAVGLALVGFVANQGLPGFHDSPIPAGPATASAVHDAVALDGSASGPAAQPAQVLVPGLEGSVPTSSSPPRAVRRGNGLRQAHVVKAGPSPQPKAPPSAPSSPPSAPAAPVSPGAESAPPPAPAPVQPTTPVTAAVEGPDSTSRGKGNGHADGHGKPIASHAGGDAEGQAQPPGKAKGHQTAKPAHGHHAEPAPPAEPLPPVEAGDSPPEGGHDTGSDKEAHGNGHAYGKSGRGGD